MSYQEFCVIASSEGLDMDTIRILWEASPEQNGALDEAQLRTGCRALVELLGHQC